MRPEPPGPDGGPPTGAVGRAVSLLELLATGGPRSLTRLVTDTGLPKTTAHRVLRMLVAHDLVAHGPTGYEVGRRMRELANLIVGQHDDLRRIMMPFLVDLYERTDRAVRLGVLRGDECVYLETVYGARHATAVRAAGDHAPAHSTAAGKVLLAYTSGRIARQRPLRGLTAYTVADPARPGDELAAVRRTGAATAGQQQRLGLVTVAMPVLGRDRAVAAAIEIVGDAAFRPRDVATAHRQVALAASVALGGRT
ncbi:IclR family transcriptional regulator [Polymorphospora rubra]